MAISTQIVWIWGKRRFPKEPTISFADLLVIFYVYSVFHPSVSIACGSEEDRLSAFYVGSVLSPRRFPFPGLLQLPADFLDLFFKLALSRDRYQFPVFHGDQEVIALCGSIGRPFESKGSLAICPGSLRPLLAARGRGQPFRGAL